MTETLQPASMPVVFIGMPGSGKSKVGRSVAAELGVEYVDTDALVEEHHGQTIADIFAHEGEDAFRRYEADAVAAALHTASVISLGGGAVTTPRVRELLSGHTVIHIDVALEELVRRTAGKEHRPLLRENPAQVLAELLEARGPLYEEVRTHRITSNSSPVGDVIAQACNLLAPMTVIEVGGESSYPVFIGARRPAYQICRALSPASQRLLIVHPDGLSDYVADIVSDCEAAGYFCATMTHPDGEAAKTVEVLATGWDAAAQARLSRQDAIIGVGGGATTDLAGFIAATWLRGIDVIQVPTTVLGMVDAAVGGKTGINTLAGKNLAGAFHPPRAVVEDLRVLTTLPAEDVRAGFGEIIKCGFIRDPQILTLLRENPDAARDVTSGQMRELIARSVQVKADVVSADLKESGLREILNYGHTLAHAIERCENYQWRHGEAVAVGCIFAAELAHSLGMLTEADVDAHREMFELAGLPTSYSGASLEALLGIMMSDKKVRGGTLRFVLLEGLHNPRTVEITAEQLRVPARKVGIRVD